MKSMVLRVGMLGLLAGLLVACGCQKGPKTPPTYPVSGKVTYKGEPVEGATVSFLPSAEGGQAASGVTDASGQYKLTSFKKDDGAVAGQYKVAIAKYKDEPAEEEAAGGSAAGGDDSEEYPEDYTEPVGGAEGDDEDTGGEAESLLPAKYADPNASGLQATVTEQGPNNFDFALED